ncbi:DNA adenine methylase [Phyllobacterium leguminum]|uniref:site-specific DNA-methyltransferase (adenine-specific) n=1 Tax=Phyllobacterium leguminum TaxID=314237 RepID=A0A318SYA2_9HYPH|nr:DNA adenine methylase [Phyllobacterium leguminum]PYE86911.1 site-specific DNA-adenine methylase [Phyllobacterium leguminum]
MPSLEMRAVTPTSTPAPYLGGKRNLAKRICALIDATPHTLYAECFVGMGGIFLRRTSAPNCEVINDLSGDVANLFRILQRHYPQFMEVLKFQLTSRREFNRLYDSNPATLTDLERAARFIYMQRIAFGGKISGRNFSVSRDRTARFNMTMVAPILEQIYERLTGVVIENLRWQELIDRYDRPGTLFYLDPPYFGNENDYGKGLFRREEFAEMAERLARLQGRFIMSINDRPQIRELFGGFEIIPVELTYTIAAGTNMMKAKELIIHSKE